MIGCVLFVVCFCCLVFVVLLFVVCGVLCVLCCVICCVRCLLFFAVVWFVCCCLLFVVCCVSCVCVLFVSVVCSLLCCCLLFVVCGSLLVSRGVIVCGLVFVVCAAWCARGALCHDPRPSMMVAGHEVLGGGRPRGRQRCRFSMKVVSADCFWDPAGQELEYKVGKYKVIGGRSAQHSLRIMVFGVPDERHHDPILTRT